MKRLLSVCLIVCLLAAAIPAVSVAETKYGVVHGGWLRLRAAASFNAATISSYYTGTTVTILGTSGSWSHVQAPDGRTGYMYSAYLSVGGGGGGGGGGTGTATVWSSNGYGVRLRTGPGTGYRVIAVYSVGTRATILERGSYWSRIQIGGTVGYMMNQFLTGGGIPVPDPSPTGNAVIWSANGYGVRLRTGPGKGYSIIGVYSVGTKVTVLEKGPIWDKIMVGSRVGYMMNEFLIYYANNEVTNVTLNITNPVVGNVLGIASITPAGAAVTYSWLVGGVEKGTSPTYTVVDADKGLTIVLKVTGVSGYTGSATSAATAAVASATDVTRVAINLEAGVAPVVGNVLKMASVDPAGATVSYAWYVGNVLVSTADTYTVQAADVNKQIELVVTGTGAYAKSASSGLTLPVAATGVVTGAVIYVNGQLLGSAAPAVNDALTVAPYPQNAQVTYAWFVQQADGSYSASPVSASSTYTVKPGDLNRKIKVVLTGITPAYTGAADAETTLPVTNYTRITGVTLVNGGAPVFRADGGNVTVLSATITPAGLEGKVNYEWTYEDGTIIDTGTTYQVKESDVGQKIFVTVIGRDADGTTGYANSGLSGMVTGRVTRVSLSLDSAGTTITATTTPGNAAGYMTFTWYRNGVFFVNSEKSTYTIQPTDHVNDKFTVVVTASSGAPFTCEAGSITSNEVVLTSGGLPTDIADLLNALTFVADVGTKKIRVANAWTLDSRTDYAIGWEEFSAGASFNTQAGGLEYEWTSGDVVCAYLIDYDNGAWTPVRTVTYTIGSGIAPAIGIIQPLVAEFELPVVDPSVTEQPTEEQPTEEQPTEEMPTVEQPVEEPPVVEQPSEEPPIVDQPSEEPPTVEQPSEEPPVVEQPAEAPSVPANEPPVSEQPAFDIHSISLRIAYSRNALRVRGLPSEEEAGVTFGFRWIVDGQEGYQSSYRLDSGADISAVDATVVVDVYQNGVWADSRELIYVP